MLSIASGALTLVTCTLGLGSRLFPNATSYFRSGTSPGTSVHFEIHITPGQVNPTGAGFREAILVNGSFTGPTLRIETGDHVAFLVRNYLREDTAIHFHGISQSASPWADGTPGVSQRPIKPGSSFLYKWQADEPGVYFYHAHSRGQIMDGLYGAIVITPSRRAERPFHMISRDPADWASMRRAEAKLQTLMVSDWSQFSFHDFYSVEREANIDFTCMDAIVINGAGSQYCLDRQSLDRFTNPLVKAILASTGEKGITDKGCIPPLQLFQGNFSLHLDSLPAKAYRECVPGVGGHANYTLTVHSGDRWAALTFINPGGLYPLKITIDNHPLHVYAVDGQYIYPQTVDQLLVNNGERYSIFVKLEQPVGRYKIRIANDLLGQVLGGFAALSYNGVMEDPVDPKPLMNYAGQPLVPDLHKFSEVDARPYPPLRPARLADLTHKFLIKKLGQPYGAYEWTLSGKIGYNTSEEERTQPLLFQHPNQFNSTELIIKTRKGEWIDLIVEIEGPFAQSHPMHKHGTKAFVIGQGIGPFPWATVHEAAKELPQGTFNTVDPPYKDTFKTLEAVNNNSWLVLRYKAESAGAWLFHCHIQTHLAGGMGIVILDGVENYPQVPESYMEWNGFEKPR